MVRGLGFAQGDKSAARLRLLSHRNIKMQIKLSVTNTIGFIRSAIYKTNG